MAAEAASSANSVSDSASATPPPVVPKKEPNVVLNEAKEEPREGSTVVSNEIKEEPKEGSTKVPVEDNDNNKRTLTQSEIDERERNEKFKRYEAEYRRYLLDKYFSDKTIFGGNIYDVKMNIDGHTIRASRLPPYQSYLDPASFDELNSKAPPHVLYIDPKSLDELNNKARPAEAKESPAGNASKEKPSTSAGGAA